MTVPNNLPECLTCTFECDNPIPQCHNSAGFDFVSLANITHRYWKQCPAGPWLYKKPGLVGDVPEGEAALTNYACELIAGSTWKKYSTDAIWYRLTTWKFPLFQLIAVSPRPPLGFWAETFTIVRLFGDPIGSSTSLVRKLHSCHIRALHWENQLKTNKDLRLKLQHYQQSYGLHQERLQEALALIVVSYDEWGKETGDSVENYLTRELNAFCGEPPAEEAPDSFISLCLECANRLAADRSTKFLSVIIAQAIFMGNVILAIVRTKSQAKGPNSQTYIDIEMYGIGFSALCFWVISIIMLTSIIGSSQTANSIPDILTKFHRDLAREFPQRNINLPEGFDPEQRCRRGGIYSWQPDEEFHISFARHGAQIRQISTSMTSLHQRGTGSRIEFLYDRLLLCTVLPTLMVSFGPLTGMYITALVPPEGWSGRSVAELAIFIVWLISYPLNMVSWSTHHRHRFWFTFVKDFIAMAATVGLIIAAQLGIFNRCSCYTLFGRIGTALPQISTVKAILEHGLDLRYPAITVAGILIQLIVFPGIFFTRYHRAIRVFLQRDDGQRSLQWFPDFGVWNGKITQETCKDTV